MNEYSSGEDLFHVRLHVNGATYDVSVPARRLLSDALRHDLGLTGTHVGCEHGVCGACTVLLDGRPVRSCLVLAVSAVDTEITTVEEHGAGAADAVLAAHVGAGQPEVVAESVGEQPACGHAQDVDGAVDREPDLVQLLGHDRPPANSRAARTTRRVSTRTSWAR